MDLDFITEPCTDHHLRFMASLVEGHEMQYGFWGFFAPTVASATVEVWTDQGVDVTHLHGGASVVVSLFLPCARSVLRGGLWTGRGAGRG